MQPLEKASWIGADLITHLPRPQPTEGASTTPSPSARIAEHETLLSEWFGRHVVLLSSGRAGLRMLLEAKGFERYRDRLWIPEYLSRCVVNAITHNAFPVLRPNDAAGALLYHQFGFAQRARPRGIVIEDIAHSFFAGPTTGARRWRSDCAVFSLPKFFPVLGLAGGVIAESAQLAQDIRDRASSAPCAERTVRDWMRAVVRAAADCHSGEDSELGDWLDAVYELVFRFSAADADDLDGLPLTLDALSAVGSARSAHVEVFRAMLGDHWPADLWPDGELIVPFALPYFGNGEDAVLRSIDATLKSVGVYAGIYHVDVRRDMTRPDYRRCVLLPSHHLISTAELTAICEVILEVERQARDGTGGS